MMSSSNLMHWNEFQKYLPCHIWTINVPHWAHIFQTFHKSPQNHSIDNALCYRLYKYDTWMPLGATGVPLGCYWGATRLPLGCHLDPTGVPVGYHWDARELVFGLFGQEMRLQRALCHKHSWAGTGGCKTPRNTFGRNWFHLFKWQGQGLHLAPFQRWSPPFTKGEPQQTV